MPVPVLIGLAVAAITGGTVYSAVTQAAAADKAQDAQKSALNAQAAEKKRLEALSAAAPEAERQAELEKRRKRVQTLLSDQEATGMATVGTKTLLGS
jgi:hypothetical protein